MAIRRTRPKRNILTNEHKNSSNAAGPTCLRLSRVASLAWHDGSLGPLHTRRMAVVVLASPSPASWSGDWDEQPGQSQAKELPWLTSPE